MPGTRGAPSASLGYAVRSQKDDGLTLDGPARVFTMMLVGAALVIGVLVANVVVPSRKLL